MNSIQLKNIIEGFIFASDKALSPDQLIKLFPETEQPDKEEVDQALQEIMADYQHRGIELKKISSGYRFQVREEFSPWVSRLWEEKPAKYSRALLETLAIIVYRQPITRGEIEEIRGVAVSTHIIKTLQEREWIRVVGQRDVPGKPSLFGTTKQFLDYFNLQSLEQLPPLSEIKDLDEIVEELDPEQNAALLEAIREIQERSKLESFDEDASQTTTAETSESAVDEQQAESTDETNIVNIEVPTQAAIEQQLAEDEQLEESLFDNDVEQDKIEESPEIAESMTTEISADEEQEIAASNNTAVTEESIQQLEADEEHLLELAQSKSPETPQ